MKRLQRRCERRLKGVQIPDPFDLETFCNHIATQRGRRLRLEPVPGLSSGAPCGMWIALGETDVILYDPNTSKLHAEHIVLHELGHMLSDHSVGRGFDGAVLTRLMPDIDPSTIARVLGRERYSSEQEREAEMLASLIRARARRGVPAPAGDARERGALRQLADALSFVPGERLT